MNKEDRELILKLTDLTEGNYMQAERHQTERRGWQESQMQAYSAANAKHDINAIHLVVVQSTRMVIEALILTALVLMYLG